MLAVLAAVTSLFAVSATAAAAAPPGTLLWNISVGSTFPQVAAGNKTFFVNTNSANGGVGTGSRLTAYDAVAGGPPLWSQGNTTTCGPLAAPAAGVVMSYAGDSKSAWAPVLLHKYAARTGAPLGTLADMDTFFGVGCRANALLTATTRGGQDVLYGVVGNTGKPLKLAATLVASGKILWETPVTGLEGFAGHTIQFNDAHNLGDAIVFQAVNYSSPTVFFVVVDAATGHVAYTAGLPRRAAPPSLHLVRVSQKTLVVATGAYGAPVTAASTVQGLGANSTWEVTSPCSPVYRQCQPVLAGALLYYGDGSVLHTATGAVITAKYALPATGVVGVPADSSAVGITPLLLISDNVLTAMDLYRGAFDVKWATTLAVADSPFDSASVVAASAGGSRLYLVLSYLSATVGIAIDSATGKQLWSAVLPVDHVGGVTSAAVADGVVLFFGGPFAQVFAVRDV